MIYGLLSGLILASTFVFYITYDPDNVPGDLRVAAFTAHVISFTTGITAITTLVGLVVRGS